MTADPAISSNTLLASCLCTVSVRGSELPKALPQNGRKVACTLQDGDSPLQLPPKRETSGKRSRNPLMFLLRLLLGSTAGFYYFVLPVYMWIKDKVWPRSLPGF